MIDSHATPRAEHQTRRPIPTLNMFKYLGSMFPSKRGSHTYADNRVKAARASVKIRDNIYKSIAKPAMT